MRKFGVGVIGCGQISAAHLWAYGELADECEVIAVCERGGGEPQGGGVSDPRCPY
jgi:predicted dehydrogenase